MGKVLVERPRPGSRDGSRPRKGYWKRLQLELTSGDALPREGMKARCGGTRFFNEHLAPLRRFLQSNTGRPWNMVYGEICKHVDRGNVVQKHILTHLFDYVVTNVVMIDGQPCRGAGTGWRAHGEPLRTSHYRDQWYVCPKSGLLRKSKYVPRASRRPDPPRHLKLNNKQLCVFRNRRWELISVALLAQPLLEVSPAYDEILQGELQDHRATGARTVRFHRGNKYTVSRRILSQRELLALPIPYDWLK